MPSFLFPHSGSQPREQSCALCRENQGNLVGIVDYFGLGDFDMIQCPACGLVSIDPIPSEAIVAEGCRRLYALQQPNETRARSLRGFAKSYRRGARFARRYLASEKRAAYPFRILEVGAGDGYFSAGIKAELPSATVTLVDIVDELVRYYRDHHDCRPVRGEFSAADFPTDRFDLIIFRDLLEHVRDPVAFLSDAFQVLEGNGRIFFITPNGREDFWLINQRFLKTGKRSVMLLNHFHYFLPDTLHRMLQQCGFAIQRGFKFGLKQHRRGLGWKELAPTEFGEESVPLVSDRSPSVQELWQHQSYEVRRRPLSNLGLFSRAYSAVADREGKCTGFQDPVGHEFFVIARKIETFPQ